MPERLNQVTVAYSRGTVALPWSSRDALLAEVRHLDSMKPVVQAFEAVGASAPVTLTRADVQELVRQLDLWSDRAKIDQIPDGVWDLRCALYDDLNDDPGD
jgi:hypothetical protein